MTKAKRIITAGPATQPSCPIAHANNSTPDPIIAVIMCDVAVQKLPAPPQLYGIRKIIGNRRYVEDDDDKACKGAGVWEWNYEFSFLCNNSNNLLIRTMSGSNK